jgi:hypothetical protein
VDNKAPHNYSDACCSRALKLGKCPSGGSGIDPSSGPSFSEVLVNDDDETELRRECAGDEIEESSASDILIDIKCTANKQVCCNGGWETASIGDIPEIFQV